MKIDGRAWRTIWPTDDGSSVAVIDQTRLPHELVVRELHGLDDTCLAICDMVVRGAPLIGATAAWGCFLALRTDSSDAGLQRACAALLDTRPTAVNLRWALERMRARLAPIAPADRVEAARNEATRICNEDVATNRSIGVHGLALIESIAATKPAGDPVNILTHCNAGWLATVDWGTATAPIYLAHDAGIELHVWVDETRPRNQGALTAWELGHHGVPHTYIVDNAGGHLMQRREVDICLVGSDRTTRSGDVCNKIGTYLKALAAHDNGIPFYACLPGTTIDWELDDGIAQIPIEHRRADEVERITGRLAQGGIGSTTITPVGSPAANHAFDVTPSRLVTGLITERGVLAADSDSIAAAFGRSAVSA
ncbi:MAG: S-methyl-5-thioribose-1-phosphate isomerase [Gammaproteobacteria bacterium]|nr:S-methyl-5-thioribose-1-phosphate isomerase [Gammaproteobacteria bacterium]